MEFAEVIKSRRSTRKFTEDTVSYQDIMTMLEAGIAAPNAVNMQSWHFYVVTDTNVKNTLAEQNVIAEWATTAPVIFVVCTAAEELVKRVGERGETLFAIQDTAAAIENILLTATDLGLGGCFMGAFNREKLIKAVGISPLHRPVAVVPVGKPASILPPRPRNPIENAVTFVGDNDKAFATARETSFRGYEVKNSTVKGAVFENSDLENSVFINCSLRNVSFNNCDMTDVKINDFEK